MTQTEAVRETEMVFVNQEDVIIKMEEAIAQMYTAFTPQIRKKMPSSRQPVILLKKHRHLLLLVKKCRAGRGQSYQLLKG